MSPTLILNPTMPFSSFSKRVGKVYPIILDFHDALHIFSALWLIHLLIPLYVKYLLYHIYGRLDNSMLELLHFHTKKKRYKSAVPEHYKNILTGFKCSPLGVPISHMSGNKIVITFLVNPKGK